MCAGQNNLHAMRGSNAFRVCSRSTSDYSGKKPPATTTAFIPERLLDSDEAASIMKCHPKTLQKLARKGVVRGVHVGKLRRFRASVIEEWIQRQLAS
jgi:excisionase family DNA binding protein